MKKNRELLLASYGLKPEQTTLETISQARRCGVFFFDSNFPLPVIGPLIPKGRLLRGKDGGELSVEEKAAAVMAEFARHERVGVMTYGHPRFLCSIGDQLCAACKKEGIKVRALEAPSSLSATAALAGITSLENGLLCLSAINHAHSIEHLNPRLHILLYDFRHFAAKSSPHGKAFGRRLAELYPPQHPLLLLECASISPQRVERFTVETFSRAVSEASVRSTLYIPPARLKAT